MAVKLNIDPLAAMEKAGIDCSVIRQAIKEHGCKVVTTLSGIKVVQPDGEVITSIKLSPAETDLLGKGSYPPGLADVVAVASVQVAAAIGAAQTSPPQPSFKIGGNVVWNGNPDTNCADLKPGVVYKVMALYSTNAVDLNDPDGPDAKYWNKIPCASLCAVPAGWGKPSAEAEKTPAQSLGDILKSATAKPAMSILAKGGAASNAPAYPVLGGLDSPVVFLRDAVGLYCPVRGTDDNSRYFLVADFGALKMAARWKGQTLSIRFEADKLAPYEGVLAKLGLSIKKDKYASMHLSEVSDVTVCNKVIGAMIYGTGLPPLSPPPDMMYLHNKGA